MKKFRTITLAVACLIAASLTAGYTATGAAPASHARKVAGPLTPIHTVFIILMENHNSTDIIGSASAPYINNTLLPEASYTTQYYNPPSNHPSLPNYLWLEAGTNFGILNDNEPSVNHQSSTLHLVTLLNNAGITWKAYEEDITGTTCPLTTSGNYAARHDPFVYFDDVTNNQDPSSPYCIAHIRPYTELANDLTNSTVARYNFITPNICDDMHTACPGGSDQVKQGDDWLSNNIPAILQSQAYKNDGALFITWDEGEGGDGPIPMIVLSPCAKGSGYSNAIHYTHSSTLKTMEEIFGVTPLLGDAANPTNDLSDLFVSSCPTVSYVASFTATRRHAMDRAWWNVTFHWTMANAVGVVGFNLYAGTHRLNSKVISRHTRRTYAFATRWTGKERYTLHVLLSRGQDVVVPSR